MRVALTIIIALSAPASAQGVFNSPVPIDTSKFDPAGAAATAQANAIAAISGPLPKLAAIPAAGPGAGMCMEAWVPSTLVVPPGTSGSCSRILMCGTSTTYLTVATNVGSGC